MEVPDVDTSALNEQCEHEWCDIIKWRKELS